MASENIIYILTMSKDPILAADIQAIDSESLLWALVVV